MSQIQSDGNFSGIPPQPPGPVPNPILTVREMRQKLGKLQARLERAEKQLDKLQPDVSAVERLNQLSQAQSGLDTYAKLVLGLAALIVAIPAILQFVFYRDQLNSLDALVQAGRKDIGVIQALQAVQGQQASQLTEAISKGEVSQKEFAKLLSEVRLQASLADGAQKRFQDELKAATDDVLQLRSKTLAISMTVEDTLKKNIDDMSGKLKASQSALSKVEDGSKLAQEQLMKFGEKLDKYDAGLKTNTDGLWSMVGMVASDVYSVQGQSKIAFMIQLEQSKNVSRELIDKVRIAGITSYAMSADFALRAREDSSAVTPIELLTESMYHIEFADLSQVDQELGRPVDEEIMQLPTEMATSAPKGWRGAARSVEELIEYAKRHHSPKVRQAGNKLEDAVIRLKKTAKPKP